MVDVTWKPEETWGTVVKVKAKRIQYWRIIWKENGKYNLNCGLVMSLGIRFEGLGFRRAVTRRVPLHKAYIFRIRWRPGSIQRQCKTYLVGSAHLKFPDKTP